MTLTLTNGPLAAGAPSTVNYRIEGPAHRLFLEDFPRRVRAVVGGETVLDTRHGKLLHETGLTTQLYVPHSDLRADLLTATDHHTHCPFKGDASYWTLRAGDQVAENAVWSYAAPNEAASWLRGHQALYDNVVDTWLDENEEVIGLRDPYHRVDVRDCGSHVRVLVDGKVAADTDRPKVLSETGFPNRYYIPPSDVRPDLLEPSDTHTGCPYKGLASYYTLHVGERRIEDAVWYYPEPLEGALKARDHLSFYGEGVQIEVDGSRIE